MILEAYVFRIFYEIKKAEKNGHDSDATLSID